MSVIWLFFSALFQNNILQVIKYSPMCITREFVGMNIFNNFSSKLLDLINVDITFMKSKEKQKSHINVLIKVT